MTAQQLYYFLIFYSAVLSGGGNGTSKDIGLEFFRITIGGTLVGVLVAGCMILWLRRTFNDALVEITITIVAAYVNLLSRRKRTPCFRCISGRSLRLIAFRNRENKHQSQRWKNFYIVSGRSSRILLNTLIFVLVGVVIIKKVQLGSGVEWLLLAKLYIGIHGVRAIMGINPLSGIEKNWLMAYPGVKALYLYGEDSAVLLV